MIITKLVGGLGNQMFQYAIAKANQRKDEKLFLDISYFHQNRIENERLTIRDFELGIFQNIKEPVLTQKRRELYYSQQRRFLLLRKILGLHFLTISQKECEFVEIPDSRKDIIFNGFFQSQKYFASKGEELLHLFEFPELDTENKKIEDKINKSNAVSIHIRRGDYLKESVKNYHGILPEEYYLKALSLIENKESNLKYFVFSDNPEIARQLFKDREDFTYIENNSGASSWKDMKLMSQCKHHIIANSTFSWWGAWLSKNKGIKVAPKNWFNPKVANFKIEDFIPSQWEIID